jgi:hypothetical protein
MRLLPGSHRPVHAFELILKRVIEQLVTVLPEKTEQRPHARQPLHQHLLLRREIHRGRPPLHARTSGQHQIMHRAGCRSPLRKRSTS